MLHLNYWAAEDVNGRTVKVYRWSAMDFKHLNLLAKWMQNDSNRCQSHITRSVSEKWRQVEMPPRSAILTKPGSNGVFTEDINVFHIYPQGLGTSQICFGGVLPDLFLKCHFEDYTGRCVTLSHTALIAKCEQGVYVFLPKGSLVKCPDSKKQRTWTHLSCTGFRVWKNSLSSHCRARASNGFGQELGIALSPEPYRARH